jgi:hypothetical protein
LPAKPRPRRTDKDRAWKVTLAAMLTNAQAQKMTVQGKDKTLTLDNMSADWKMGLQTCCDGRKSEKGPRRSWARNHMGNVS